MADYTFRLKDTPLGTLVVKFYQVEPYSQEAFERLVQRDFLAATIPGSGGSWGSRLYQGEVDNTAVLPEAIFRLHMRCPIATACASSAPALSAHPKSLDTFLSLTVALAYFGPVVVAPGLHDVGQ